MWIFSGKIGPNADIVVDDPWLAMGAVGRMQSYPDSASVVRVADRTRC
jgi:hypothetical protein